MKAAGRSDKDQPLAVPTCRGTRAGTEMASVQQGAIMAVTELNARRGALESVYQGEVYIIDAMTNNPGAAGGALTNIRGQLIGMLGKELRDNSANIWLNYAIPMSVLSDSIKSIIAGESISRRSESRPLADRPANLPSLGVVLIPNVLSKTPAFVDLVQPDSVADLAGLKSDDLILFINSSRVTSQLSLQDELKYIDRTEDIVLLVQRGGQLQEIVLSK